MKAAPEAQRRLLDLQAIDTALRSSRTSGRRCRSISALNALAREISDLDDERIRAQVGVDDIDRDIARLEKDIEQVRARSDKDRGAARRRHRPGPRARGAAARADVAAPAPVRAGGHRAGVHGAAGDRARRRLDAIVTRLAEARSQRRDAEAERDAALAEIDRRTDGQAAPAARSPPTCRPTWSRSTTRSARPVRRPRRGAAAQRPLRRLPARALRRRAGPGPRRGPRRGRPLRRVPAHHGPHRGVRSVTSSSETITRVIVEADGGARGNPGPAGFGALVARPADRRRCSPNAPARCR